jgi:hypothetical protein
MVQAALLRIQVAVMIKRIRAEVLALGIKCRARAEAVSQETFHGIRQIIPAKDGEHIL